MGTPAMHEESAVVIVWNADEGWGVARLDIAKLDVWIHFSAIDAPANSYRSLTPGQRVLCRYEMATQDGYTARAAWVRAQ
ncbi:cold shock domain-containing protein [Micromonospora sp. STR1s_6]|uniref:Cold shock domain-containing protein n=1 Tax=Micromonospora tarensis TaxID=2806100 RepID=A0ABS1YIV2_9ACTN|nr:cold shock domain-containing protein [Micromonospora tarensis]